MFKRNTNRIVITLLVFFFYNNVKAANTALTSGAWETGSNWSQGFAPLSTDNVIIPSGITITVKVAGDVCGSLTIAASGTLIINSAAGLSIGGNLNNAGFFTAIAGSTLTFNGLSASTITGGGTYSITGGVVLNMASKITLLDIQDANFISGINTGGKYFINLKRGTWKMNNTGTLNDCYNIGSTNAITIPFEVIIEADKGIMNLARNAPTGNAVLSGEVFVNGGIVNVQAGQAFNSGQDFQYRVNGGLPQLYITSGTLNVGAGFNAGSATDYIDFHMTGGILITALNGYSNWITFQLADVLGGKTFMSGGTIILQDATNANIQDLDMGGANVAATQYSVTGGTVQLGYINTQSSASFFGINAQPSTNYPNINFQAGVPKTVSAFVGGNINMLSLYVNTNMTFDASGFSNVNIIGSNGTFAFDDEGGFIQGTSTVTFSGSVNQVIRSTALTNEIFYNLIISNTSGNVTLAVPVTVSNRLTLTAGLLDASAQSLTISSGNIAISGGSSGSYIITGNGITSTGQLNINNISSGIATWFPVGTTNYYLPFSINPGVNTGNSYAAFVFTGVTTNGLANGPAFTASTMSKMFNATWNIIRTAGSGTSTVALNWFSSATVLEGSAFQGYGLNIGIAQCAGGAWQSATGSGNVSAKTVSSTFNSFSQFSIVGNGTVLALDGMDFNAVLNENKMVLITWSVSDIANIGKIQVQKNTDGIHWTDMGSGQIENSSISESHYSLIDTTPVPGLNFYRLSVHKINSVNNFSDIKSVNLPFSLEVSLFPNPANNFIHVLVKDKNIRYTLRIINSEGRSVCSSNPPEPFDSSRLIDVRFFPAGTYFLQVISGYQTIKTVVLSIIH